MRNSHTQCSTATKVKFLTQSANYPDCPSQVEVRETHMSWVFLGDRYVYKLKKPLCTSFLDFSTTAARHRNCHEELRLNRRLAPDVYLDIVPLCVDTQGTLHLGKNGEVVDWLVKMRRLPPETMLDHAIEMGTIRQSEVRAVAQQLAEFYQASQPIDLTPLAYRYSLVTELNAILQVLESHDSDLPLEQVKRIAKGQLKFLASVPEIFEHRIREKRIVEGHGDLRPQHICLGPKIAIIDCLEFNRTLRTLDPVDELAFLALECERLGASWVGDLVLDVYSSTTQDIPPHSLIAFYKAYRAYLHAKLAVWHTKDPGKSGPEQWLNRARTYLKLAEQYLPPCHLGPGWE